MRFEVDKRDLSITLLTLSSYPKAVRRRVLRIGLSAAGGQLMTEVRAIAPKETGLLKRSIGVKTTIPRDERKPAYAVVGAKRGISASVVTTVSGAIRTSTRARIRKLVGTGKRNLGQRIRRPSRYLHLAERTHRFMAIASRNALRRAELAFTRKIKQGVEFLRFGQPIGK